MTQGNDHSYLPSLSRTGRYLGLGSDASNLVGGDSVSASDGAAVSGDGHTFIYPSYAQNLVAGDESDYQEIFAWHD